MTSFPIVSIIIPVYKVEPYIIKCIDSVLHQNYRFLEIILVDDKTPDNSMQMAIDYIEQSKLHHDLHFKYVKHDCNRGLSAARNTGIDAATGEYLFFLDSDDEITSDCIEKLVKEVEEGNYDVACGNFRIDGYVSNYWKNYQHKELKSHERMEILRHFINHNVYMMAWNKLVRRKLITSKLLYFKEGIIHEDELWSFLLSNQASSMSVIMDVTYIYRVREDSIITANSKRKSFSSKIIILKEFYKLIKKGDIVDIPENHNYITKKKDKWINGIFNSHELTPFEKIRYLMKTISFPNGILYTLKFVYSRLIQKI